MGENTFYNILMYSHDTYGLGHIRRTMALAAQLRSHCTNILILTGSPIAGRFAFPENVDFVRIPGMIKKTNDEYHPLSIRINPDHALHIRQSIISATARNFKPDLFIVDKEPLGLKQEVLPILQWFKQNSPQTKTILGLRDIMDDSETVRLDWQHKGVYQYLDDLYSEIWVYGRQDIYDAITEYDIPVQIQKKIHFTGYLPRKQCTDKAKQKTRKKFCVRENEKMIVVTAGGGGDGYQMMDTYLNLLESRHFKGHKSILITGPFMPKKQRRLLAKKAKPYSVKIRPFYPKMEELFGAADLIISMGGYNTVCEIISQATPCLIIPREKPRKEQLLRAQAFKKQFLIDFIPWDELNSQKLHKKITSMMQNLDTYKSHIAYFQLDGIDFIKKRLQHFRESQP